MGAANGMFSMGEGCAAGEGDLEGACLVQTLAQRWERFWSDVAEGVGE